MATPAASSADHAAAPFAVVADGVSVRYEAISETLSADMKARLRNLHRRSKRKRVVHALRDVSFKVPRGSVYGVIGHNGAGKSTLFRVLAGVLPPDDGRVEIYGRVTPLLSLGVGFNRQLTGRENILLGGLAVGLDAAQVEEHTADILAFADLGDIIDRPMRTYSSGMFGRLGFAIAAHLDPEIILIDEALSAGDAAFKKKCSAKLQELVAGDCTVMIVTHGVAMVKRMGDRCLWLDRGSVVTEGPADEVVQAYLEAQGAGGADDLMSQIDV